MDVEVPEGPIRNLKQFLVQIFTITVGVLIALGIESVSDWRHHRSLVAEAVANLDSEIRDNKKDLASTLAKAPETKKQLETFLGFVNDLTRKKPDQENRSVNLSLGYSAATLSSTSRTTAEATGALGHMSYAQVKRYAQVYDLQSDFLRLQQRLVDQFVVMLSSTQSGGLDNPSGAELERTRQALQATLSHLSATMQYGRQLSRVYDEVLARK